MELVTIGDNDLPTFNPAVKEIREFKTLLQRDKGTKNLDDIGGDHDGRKKLIATKELAFIYFYSEFNSTYEVYSGDEKIDKIKKDLELPSNWKIDDDIKAAILKYEELMFTPSVRLYKKAAKGLRMVENFIDALDEDNDDSGLGLTKTNKSGSLIFSPKDMIDLIKNVPVAMKALNEAEKLVKQELDNIKGKNINNLSGNERNPAIIKGNI